MYIKQLSVFVENREGRLEQVTQTLADNNISIVCISLADTSEYGMLRLVVSDPDRAKTILKENGFSAMLTNVIGVKLPHYFGELHKLTKILSGGNLNIEYMYALTSGKDNAAIIIKTSNNDEALKAIQASTFELINPSDAYNL